VPTLLKVALLSLVMSMWLAAPAHAQAPKRLALVMVNSSYADAPLKSPVNDASDLSEKLRGLGFQVTLLTVAQVFKGVQADVERDTDRRQSPQAESGLTAAFYFATPLSRFCGAGTRWRCTNYLSGWPQGQDAALAETRRRELDALERALAAAAGPAPPASAPVHVADGRKELDVLKDWADSPLGCRFVGVRVARTVWPSTQPSSLAPLNHGCCSLQRLFS